MQGTENKHKIYLIFIRFNRFILRNEKMRNNYQLKEKIENSNNRILITYKLKRDKRRQIQNKWKEGLRSGINDLHAMEGPQKASSG